MMVVGPRPTTASAAASARLGVGADVDAAAASSTMATAVYRIGCARTQLLGGGLAASGKKRAALRRPVKAAGVKASALYEKRSFTKSLINDCTERA